MDAVYKQLDYLAGQLTQMEAEMIDPREFGRLEGAVTALKADVDQLKGDVKDLSGKMDEVLDKLSEAKGGWKLLMAMGGAAATLGGLITWFATHTIHFGPKP